MAIKGKGKTRPKQVARAPRREPVIVHPPLLRRRWVQLAASFLLGVFAMVVVIWATNGLRESSADADAEEAARLRGTAAGEYKQTVEGAMSKLGTLASGLPPSVFPELNAALQAMSSKATVPDGAVATFNKASDDAQTAIDDLSAFDISTSIADHGFTALQALAFSQSREQLVGALQTYQRTAEAGVQAAGAHGEQLNGLTKLATDLRDDANQQLQRGWATYQAALVAGGVAQLPPGPIPGLPGGG